MNPQAARPLGYSGTQKLLHWLTAIMVFILIPVGLYMKQRGAATNFDALTNQLYTAHKTFGFLLLWIVALRIAIKRRHGTPPPEASLNRLQILVSNSVHHLLYVLLILVPLLGWAGVSAYPATGTLLGVNLPSILPVNTPLAEKILMAHGIGAITLALLVAMHIGAALMHVVVLKDGVMRRMLP